MSDAAPKVFNILFLCTGNSCRSIIAEAVANRLGQGRFKAYSAGSMPTGHVNPHALRLLEQMGYETGGYRSKGWEEFSRDSNPDAPDLDFVFTVCDNAAGEVCPYWPGQPMTAHWGMPDPALATGAEAEIALAFSDTYRMLTNRIGAFMSLPMASLDRLSLQKRLEAIGKSGAEQPA
ncbi:MAG: arsenate reductase ArsC [Proteobacteria bacterium]|nr:arsenate reductase ArsC [Pseudomonadota bacterium]